MKMLLIDTKTSSSRIVDIKDELTNYYKLIDCKLISITVRKIDGHYYDVIGDDEALFYDEKIISAVSEDGRPQLVGSLLICNHDGNGNESGLSEEDIEILSRRLATATSPNGKSYHVIVFDNEEEF